MKIKNKDIIKLYLLLQKKIKEFNNDLKKCESFINNMSNQKKQIYEYLKNHPEIISNYIKTNETPKINFELKGNNHYCLIRDSKTNNIFLVISDINNKLQILKWAKNCIHSLNQEFNLEEEWINKIFPYINKNNDYFEFSFGTTEKISGNIKNNKIVFKSGIYEI